MPAWPNGRVSNTRDVLKFHPEEAGFIPCEGASCDESVSLSSSPPHSEDFVDRPWRHIEPQPLRWHPWSYRSTRAIVDVTEIFPFFPSPSASPPISQTLFPPSFPPISSTHSPNLSPSPTNFYTSPT